MTQNSFNDDILIIYQLLVDCAFVVIPSLVMVIADSIIRNTRLDNFHDGNDAE